jgi:hypothetical protein
MTPLGKPLVFYLKYMDEMNRFQDETVEEGEAPDLTGLEDAERVREMAHAVGVAADTQAADFLELCGRGIESHFTGIGATLANKRKRTSVLRDWYWWVHVRHPSVPSHGWFSCAVFIYAAPDDMRNSLGHDVWGVVEPYLWFRGGRKGAEAVWNILGSWPHSRAGSTVTLACIPIKAKLPDSFDVDRDPLIAEVVKTIARIGAEETKAIADFVAGLRESEEG